MAYGPGINIGNAQADPFQLDADLKPTPQNGIIAYRHADQTLNAVFMDGHGENMAPEEAVKLEYAVPTGTIVNNPALLAGFNIYDPDAAAGRVP
jgi:prepilin-type processing-associated H-X9-DG protein